MSEEKPTPTLRDYFAGQVMRLEHVQKIRDDEVRAAVCYTAANAMMKVRNMSPEQLVELVEL